MKRGREYPRQTKRVKDSSRTEREERVAEVLRSLSGEQLHDLYCRVMDDVVTNKETQCVESLWLSDRPRGDSIQQIELNKNERTRPFDFDDGKRHAFTPTHIIMAWEGTFLRPGDTVSHLCGNFRCLNREHLIVESLKSNVQRKYCKGVVLCHHCEHEIQTCVHEPKCLIKTRSTYHNAKRYVLAALLGNVGDGRALSRSTFAKKSPKKMKRVRSDKEKKRARERMAELREERQQKPDRGQNAFRVASLTAEQTDYLWQKIEAKCYYDDNGCLIFAGPLKEKGYPAGVTLQKSKWKPEELSFRINFPFPAAQIALIRVGKLPSDAKDTASHLCAVRACVNADHLVWESQSLNARRIGCPGVVECTCCDAKEDKCKHEPKCKITTKIQKIT